MSEHEKQESGTGDEWLYDKVWHWETYKIPRPDWDHDHCVDCSRRIAEADYGDPKSLQAAYVTRFADEEGNPTYDWVCPDCFERLRDTFRWHLADESEPQSG